MKKPTLWNKLETDHYVSPSRLMGIAPTYTGAFDFIPDHIMDTLIAKGKELERAFLFHFKHKMPLRESMGKHNSMYEQFQLLLDFLEEKELKPLTWEHKILNHIYMESGFVDLICINKYNQKILIELKTRNLEKTVIKESDELQMYFYLDNLVFLEPKDYNKDNFLYGFVICVDRKERRLLCKKVDYANDNLQKKLNLLRSYYDNFIRQDVNFKYNSDLEKAYKLKVNNATHIYVGKNHYISPKHFKTLDKNNLNKEKKEVEFNEINI